MILVLLIYHAGLNAPPTEHRIALPSRQECAIVANAINNRQFDALPFMEAKCR